jgi:hypothetical protein
MGRWFTEYTNRRHKTYGAQILAGDGVHTRGWDAGVRVTCHEAGPDGTADGFTVHMTWGSHDSGTAVLVGTVYDTPEGPVWVPEKMPRNRRRLRVPARLRAIRTARKPPRSYPVSEQVSSHSPAYAAAAAGPATPRAYPVMAYVYDENRELVDSVLVYSLASWAGLVGRQPPGFRVLDTEWTDDHASTEPVTPLTVSHLIARRLDPTVFGPEYGDE